MHGKQKPLEQWTADEIRAELYDRLMEANDNMAAWGMAARIKDSGTTALIGYREVKDVEAIFKSVQNKGDKRDEYGIMLLVKEAYRHGIIRQGSELERGEMKADLPSRFTQRV